MTRFLIATLLFCLCSTSAFAQEDFELPTEDDAVVLMMDFVGGERMPTPPGFVRQPHLQVFANGRVLHSPNSPRYEATEYQMTAEELNALLDQVVNEYKFYEIDGEQIKQDFADGGFKIMIADGGTLKLNMNLGRGEHAISLYGLGSMKRKMPKNEAAQNLSRIERRCRKLVTMADVGGPEKLNAFLEKANAKMEANGQEPYDKSHLVRVGNYPHKSTVVFMKKATVDGNRMDVRVEIATGNDGTETVEYTARPVMKRR